MEPFDDFIVGTLSFQRDAAFEYVEAVRVSLPILWQTADVRVSPNHIGTVWTWAGSS
jgi:hypothetical protein